MVKRPITSLIALLLCVATHPVFAQSPIAGNNAGNAIQLPALQPKVIGLAGPGQLISFPANDADKVFARLKSTANLPLIAPAPGIVIPGPAAGGLTQNYTRGYGFANAKPLKFYDLLLREPLDRYAFYPAAQK